MSFQRRRRGQPAKVYKTAIVTDGRGNETYRADMSQPIDVHAAFLPQRSSRAELPGQQQINVMRMLVEADLPDVNLWSIVEWRGLLWDVVTPPSYHHGTRQVRHWSIDLRERP